ncbi:MULTISPECIES: sensor histidine kinase [unclassified Streptomyces]|uniref:sensor histidine kinase n=1 Tax=unclassified Streptomyces TaxID=2593676 RepID=UPI00225B7AB4|nr:MULTISPECIES: histidine kinase [unclassified Streptomyces]MCX4548083.1 histidine kinase [Streptomyces sp. NBC_01500]WSC19747.1 histidine kinase [Streptomyces sp. NBC_01766]WSV53771.1 histidine kinase [Streptomyces sp. NBC_01014]
MRRERIVVDLALWALVSAPVVLWAVVRDGGPWWRAVSGVAVLAAGIALSRFLPLTALLLTVVLALTTTLELWTPAYAIALATFGCLAGRRTALARPALHAFAGTAAVGLLLTRIAHRDLWTWLTQLTTLAFAVMVPWLVGRYARQYAQLIDTGWLLADRLEREQRGAADRARLRERSRIAGDMHDSLGHELSLIAVRAAALEVDPSLGAKQQSAAGELRAAAGDATARLRDIIGVLRENDEAAPVAPTGESVTDQVKRAQESGMEVELRGEVPAGDLAPMTRRAVHRTVQESLTNAAKHAPGARVTVVLTRSDSALKVTVTSTARSAGPAPDPPGSGTGLVGLDERIRLAGGVLTHGPLPAGGFEVTATLPPAPGPPPLRTPETSPLARELARARQQVRRRLKQAIWVPLAATAAIGALIGAVGLFTRYETVLDRSQYELIRVGDARADVRPRLPPHSMENAPDGAPQQSAGPECTYYRTSIFASLPAYRLCFADGKLVSKAVVAETVVSRAIASRAIAS